MKCAQIQELLSAGLDGELSAFERRVLDEHVSTCRSCQVQQYNLASLHRAVRVRSAEAVPDLTAAIMSKAHPSRPGRYSWVRYALAIVALTELVLALPALFLGEDTGASIHVARHVGSLTVALAIGLAYAAWRPVRAFGLLPVAGAVAACTLITAIIDASDGQVAMIGETHHLLDLAGVVLLWLLAGRPVPNRLHRPAVHLA